MQNSYDVIERALLAVAHTKAMRERHRMQRMEFQKRAEMVAARPAYVLKRAGQQLSLELNS
ncbi:hypothetical protein [Pararhizobium sp.]|uniref:hypothetical protein n=1 Tax=Pararhizobium sp. TaxID=1977563 RepID=UPI0027266925|nr:hypothetical protein [Pararhizobium sp.]MDO9415653.1 hypothetical protein [Pararhizobium sp.]